MFNIQKEASKFQDQIEELRQAYENQKDNLHLVSQLYQDEELEILNSILSNTSQIVHCQGHQNIKLLKKMSALINAHFDQMAQLVTQTMKPFLPKIIAAEKQYQDHLRNFLKVRETLKEQVKGSSGLKTLEQSLYNSGGAQSPEAKAFSRRMSFQNLPSQRELIDGNEKVREEQDQR